MGRERMPSINSVSRKIAAMVFVVATLTVGGFRAEAGPSPAQGFKATREFANEFMRRNGGPPLPFPNKPSGPQNSGAGGATHASKLEQFCCKNGHQGKQGETCQQPHITPDAQEGYKTTTCDEKINQPCPSSSNSTGPCGLNGCGVDGGPCGPNGCNGGSGSPCGPNGCNAAGGGGLLGGLGGGLGGAMKKLFSGMNPQMLMQLLGPLMQGLGQQKQQQPAGLQGGGGGGGLAPYDDGSSIILARAAQTAAAQQTIAAQEIVSAQQTAAAAR